MRERREGHQGGSWHRGGVRGRLGNASVEAGGGHGERARGRHASVLLAREEDDRGGVAVAGWAVLLGQVGYQVSAR